ncbi:MPT63 family protein [Mycobacterium avium]|uniref:MPT63 family protein n=1 Tax=Mycobacterium avium TaxID=1764 RepID=UPI00211B8319|nr:MPT63 family protein [Mycobacterium avium]MDO2394728.1 MPT63 family protein [Mycobacterium avium subsp. hominissuis]
MSIIRTTILAAIAATGGALSAGLAHADPATAVAAANTTNLHTLGSPTQIGEGTWTVTNLKPSSDAIPYHLNGTLWEATATDEATHGSTTPIVSNFNARARSGQTYRELFQVATAQGVNPAGLAQGQQTSGKLYFDVTGDAPDSVTYNAGGPDLAVWVQPPPSTASTAAGGPGRGSVGNGSPTSGTGPPPTPTAVPASNPGSVGTPATGLAQGTPLPGAVPGGPQAPGAAAPAAQPPQAPVPGAPQTPAPAAPLPQAPGAPQPPAPGSLGTPLAPGTDQQPVSAPQTPAPQTPAPQQGATAPAASTPTP